MARYIATIQQGHRTESHKKELDAGLTRIAAELLGDNPTEPSVSWKEIPKGWGFTAGELSSTSIVVCIVPDELPVKTRLDVMTRISHHRLRGCHRRPARIREHVLPRKG